MPPAYSIGAAIPMTCQLLLGLIAPAMTPCMVCLASGEKFESVKIVVRPGLLLGSRFRTGLEQKSATPRRRLLRTEGTAKTCRRGRPAQARRYPPLQEQAGPYEPQQLLFAHGIKLTINKPGQYYSTCPECSSKRKKEHQKLKVLGILLKRDGGVIWNRHHCSWSGPSKRSNGAKPELQTYVYRDNAGVRASARCGI